MKKILSLILIMISIFSVNFVFAEGKNKLYLSSEDDNLYYDSDKFDGNIFLQCSNLIPGAGCQEELSIENDSSYSYDLYFKVKETKQSSVANELLDNLLMKVYLEDELIYDGKVKGKDYSATGVNLQDSIYLGNYPINSSKKLKVEVKLDENYSNINNKEVAKTTWEFYANIDGEIKEVVPNTYDSIMDNILVLVISIVVLLLAISIYFYMNKKKKNRI